MQLLGSTMTSTITCQLAKTPDDLDTVYRMRYECYSRRGAIGFDVSQRFCDSFDQLPNHFSFLAASEEMGPLATVRISVVRLGVPGWETSPGGAVFGDDRSFQRIARESYVEASRLCFRPQARRDVLYRLVASMVALADHHQTEWLVACPRLEHSGIYQRMFKFRPVAAPRQYFGVSFQTELLAIRRDEIRRVADRVRAMGSAWMEARKMLKSGPMALTA
jgi:hypothetical protein